MSLILAAGSVVDHLVDTPLIGKWLSAHHVLLILTALAMIGVFKSVALRARAGVPGGFPNLMEVALVWVRDEIVYPWLGQERGRRYLFFFWTLFFFILVNNLLGLMPFPFNLWGKTATGNINVTAGLALMTFVLVQASGMRQHGSVGYWLHLVPHGIHWLMWPLIFAIEVIGLFTKPFALTVRLFANMTAGHAILAVLIGFMMGVAHYPNAGIGGAASLASLAFMLFIMLFETLVALIQAYIFTVLSAIFVSLAVAEEH
ncbi:MAG: F0F1 ATP synthase subunit A [Planctomycetaceae bacterium]